MKGLYINTIATSSTDIGVAKKIKSQIKALEKNNIKMDYLIRKKEGRNYSYLLNELEIENTSFSRTFLKKIYYYFFYPKKNEIIKKIKKYDFIYIRSYKLTYGGMKFLKELKKISSKIIWEIPTYPYDKECRTLESKVLNKLEKLFFRKNLKKYVDKIVTFSENNKIFGISTIKISNGIDLNKIIISNKKIEKRKNEINFITVAKISFWHGIDRFILSMAEYYKNPSKEIIKFHIVGEGQKDVVELLKKLVKNNNLQEYVIFYGFKSGKELDDIYSKVDVAVGSLGRHRSGIYELKTLKNREYAAKGLPIIYSENDLDFEDTDFIYKVTPNENLIDIKDIINWQKNLKITSSEIRKFSEKFSWDIQMKKVIDDIKFL